MHPLIVGALATPPALAAPPPQVVPFRELTTRGTWSVEHGLPECMVTDVLAAHDGFLWVATHGGLARFDGVGFESFGANTPGFETARVTCLLEPAPGELLAGTSEGLFRIEDGRFERLAGLEAPEASWVNSLEPGRDGEAWICATQLYRLRPGGVRLEPVDLGLPEPIEVVSDVLFEHGADPTLIVATDRGVLRVRLAGSAGAGDAASVEVLVPDAREDFARLARDGEGLIWAFGGRRALALVGAGERTIELDLDFELRDAVLDGNGHDSNGSRSRLLFVGDRWVRELRVVPAAGDPLAVERAWLEPVVDLGGVGPAISIAAGSYGDLWVGRAWIGLQLLRREPFCMLGDEEGHPFAAWHLTRLGTDAQLRASPTLQVQVLTGAILRFHGVGAGPAGVERVETLGLASPALPQYEPASDGTLWQLIDGHLEQLDAEGALLQRIPSPVANGRSLVATVEHGLWVSADRALARVGDVGRGPIAAPGSLPVTRVVAAPGEGANGGERLWFLSADAAWLWEESTGETLELIAPGTAELRDLWPESDGTVWLSTYGRGLLRWRRGELLSIDRRTGLLDECLGGIRATPDGRLFVNSNRGVLVVERSHIEALGRGERARIDCRLLDTGEGCGSTSTEFVGASGEPLICFPTMRGLALIDPSLERAPPDPPAPIVDSLLVDGREQRPQRALRVPPGFGDIGIAYVSPAFGRPEGVRYRYRLEGRDRDWVEAGQERKAVYRGLPPGTYRFRVAAGRGAGTWAEAPPLLLELEPHFRQTVWFTGLVGLFLLLAGYALHRSRVRTLREHGLALQAEIRDRRAAEEVRRRAEDQLRESTKLEAVGRLAGGIAHDFNNVLTAILGHVELLRGRAEVLSADDVREHADSIEACSSKAESLTQQLLAFSRRQVLRPRVIDVNGIVLGLEKLLSHLLPETLELIIRTSPEAGCVRADPSQLEQVVMNLVLNARDASPDGGELLVETRRETLVEDGEVRSYAVVSVTDQGRGIHPDDLPHVFEPFFTTKGASGTGLGLASVHGIVVQSGGRVVVESERGKGTTFRVLLPSVQGELTLLEEEHAPVAAHRGSETVLVCDDYDPVRSVTRRTLELYGYRVLVADHPARALEVARRSPQPVSLLVTDFAMPGMTGRELADRMLFEHPHLRVLFISGYTANVALRRQVVDDEVAFLPKPFSPEDLARKVREVLDGRRATPTRTPHLDQTS